MHQRDRHFAAGGTELNAPQYIYFDKLTFMREFSIKKDPQIEFFSNESASNISPDRLVYEEKDRKDGNTMLFADCTFQFIEYVKQFPILYDEHAEMRKYRSKEAWKKIAENLGGKFSVGKLRQLWITLMRAYKMYLSDSNSCGDIDNEELFELMSFANRTDQNKRDMTNSACEAHQYMLQIDENSGREFIRELSEEHLISEEVDEEGSIENDEVIEEQQIETQMDHDEFEIAQAIESIEETPPEPKRLKLESEIELTALPQRDIRTFLIHNPTTAIRVSSPVQVSTQTSCNLIPVSTPNVSSAPAPVSGNDDEFDYFGKKVALQLREIAQKNRSLARKGEIRVLQLLMELEECL